MMTMMVLLMTMMVLVMIGMVVISISSSSLINSTTGIPT